MEINVELPMNADMEMIRLEKAVKCYADGAGREIVALRTANLCVRGGDFIAVSGPSGSGKTTLLSIMGCLSTPDKGEVFIQGSSVTGMSERERSQVRFSRIGFVFQESVFMEGFNVWENVVAPLAIKSCAEATRDKAAQLLEKVGLAGRADSPVRGLSFGERKRVALARALAGDPGILLADEPTGGLDTESAESVFSILEELNKVEGRTVVFVTHDERFAVRAARNINIIDGRLML